MPELPEVEIIKQGLERQLIDLVIKNIEVRNAKSFSGDSRLVNGRAVKTIRRKAKVLMIDLANGYSLLVHLKMTGQLVYQSKDETQKVVGGHPQQAYNQPLPHAHTHVIFTFTDGSRLFFNDLRKFGWVRIMPTMDVEHSQFLKKIGPEPLTGMNTNRYRTITETYPNRTVFQSLLDQTLVAGLGNIYANEALYEAKILPERRVKDITSDEWSSLYNAVRHVLLESIKRGGTSDSTFVSVDGTRGDYLTIAHVYHKKTANPCGHPVLRKKLSGRTIHFCNICQE